MPSPDFLPLVGTKQPKIQPWYHELGWLPKFTVGRVGFGQWPINVLGDGERVTHSEHKSTHAQRSKLWPLRALRKEKGGHLTPEVWSRGVRLGSNYGSH